MSDVTAEDAEDPPKKSKLPLILALVAAVVGAGGGFFATFSGILFAPEMVELAPEAGDEEVTALTLPDVAYIPMDPLVISIGDPSERRHLRFRAELEVPKKYKNDVEAVMPRVVDILNSYLRAVRIEDLERSTALMRIRSQMLHRIDIVTGRGRVNDLLVMEFVLN